MISIHVQSFHIMHPTYLQFYCSIISANLVVLRSDSQIVFPLARTPHPMITHTSDSHQIPSQKKTKSKLQIQKNIAKNSILTEGRSETNIPPPPNNFFVRRIW